MILVAQILAMRLPRAFTGLLFILYAVLNGVTLSAIALLYTVDSILVIFAVSCAMFFGLALYGFTTKKDLSSWGTFLFVAMLGVFVSSIVNIFLQNSMFDIIISAIAVIVFAGLTVYDNQAYKKMYEELSHDKEMIGKLAMLGAIHMYINFIMIFINLLKLFGTLRGDE
jgi:FtsH-binding integral membrane protein